MKCVQVLDMEGKTIGVQRRSSKTAASAGVQGALDGALRYRFCDSRNIYFYEQLLG